MALINCPDCNNEVSDSAKICPNCNANIQEYLTKEKWKIRCKTWWPSILIFILGFIIVSLFL